MRKICITFLVVYLCFQLAYAQSNADLKEFFLQAESHFIYGEYELANPLYIGLLDLNSENANIQYKIGECYLNIPFEKTKAISYLEAAIKNSDYNSKPESFRETKAPLEAYFSLGKAYLINNELDKAISTYSRFKDMLAEENEMMNSDFIDQQILACNNAKKFMEEPISILKEDLGEDLKITAVNYNPAVSGDQSSLVFTCNFGEDHLIYHSKKVDGQWTLPVDITYQIGSNNDCTSSSLNYDGTELYVYKEDEFVGNIYVSYYENGTWTRIQKLNRNINTKFYESHACISFDGNTLYFTSNREGGEGALDIYKSVRNERGDWGPAENLGPAINTPFNENTPFITMNNSLLYFSSEGHYNMGGYDVFKAWRKGEGWTTPENIGYPVNTTDDDLFFQPVENGNAAYYSMLDGYKEQNIFKLLIRSEEITRVIEVKGILSVEDSTVIFDERFKINLITSTGQDTIDVSFPNKLTGRYSFTITPGDYTLSFEGEGYLTKIENISLPGDFPEKELFVDVFLETDPDYLPGKTTSPPVIDLSNIPLVEAIDSATLVEDVVVRDVDYQDQEGEEVLYFTVQLMALKNPVDVSYFKEFTDVKVVHGRDEFYRYTTGRFETAEEANEERIRIIGIGYPDVFVKKIYREDYDNQ
ncbi:MAG: PD40 domain-containing protein [Bacteroidales bacterium]|nr:MAG: PD40 domain-containing protein [Bacteroidales bacterium]